MSKKIETTMFFTASWCAACKTVKRMLSANPDIARRIVIIDIDTEAGEAAMRMYRVEAIPCFIRGDGDERHVGALNKRELLAFMEG